MNRRLNKRVFAAVALLAAVLMLVLPLAGFVAIAGPANAPQMSALTDCDMCPRTMTVMASCAQALCGLAAMETSRPAAGASAPVGFAPARIAIPLGQHTAPPVSPG